MDSSSLENTIVQATVFKIVILSTEFDDFTVHETGISQPPCLNPCCHETTLPGGVQAAPLDWDFQIAAVDTEIQPAQTPRDGGLSGRNRKFDQQNPRGNTDNVLLK